MLDERAHPRRSEAYRDALNHELQRRLSPILPIFFRSLALRLRLGWDWQPDITASATWNYLLAMAIALVTWYGGVLPRCHEAPMIKLERLLTVEAPVYRHPE